MHHDAHQHAAPSAPSPHGQGIEHAGHDVAAFQRRFWVCLILTIPILLYASPIQQFFGLTPPPAPLSLLIPLILSTIIFVYGGSVFNQGAVAEIQRSTLWSATSR